MENQSILTFAGSLAKQLRLLRGFSRKELSNRSGVSERFLAQFESGDGNISLSKFAAVAKALSVPPSELLNGYSDLDSGFSTNAVALVGLRGAGKSTVGMALAEAMGFSFVEVDQEIEEIAGLSLGEIFELHGESYYRKLEKQALENLQSRSSLVLATGGSIVTHRENFELLGSFSTTVWLKAKAQEHWERVVAQGDRRPMAENPSAFEELRSLLKTRSPLYAKADFSINTSTKNAEEIVRAVRSMVLPKAA